MPLKFRIVLLHYDCAVKLTHPRHIEAEADLIIRDFFSNIIHMI